MTKRSKRLANAYSKYPVFTQEQASPLHFVLVAVFISTFAAILFGKTRRCWADGLPGGATYGLFLGLIFFWVRFYDVLVYEGYPYHLSWCQGGINLIVTVIAGSVMGVIYKRS